MTEKLFEYAFDIDSPNITQMWQLLIDYVYPITTNIRLWFFVWLSITNVWHWHSLCSALSSNVERGVCEFAICFFHFSLFYFLAFYILWWTHDGVTNYIFVLSIISRKVTMWFLSFIHFLLS